MRLSRLVWIAILLSGGTASGQDAAKFFDDNCAMCHAIGGPPGGAPDLKDVTAHRDRAWLVRFILNPEETAKIDPEATALVKQYDGMVMPAAENATPAIVEALLKYIERASGTSPPSAAATAPVRSVTAIDVAAGRDLYVGRRTLTRRGPSCVSCHRLESVGGFGGGMLGPDLTAAHQRLGGTPGLSTWLSNPPTRVMRAVFREQPLADEETFALAAMLGDAGARQPAAHARPRAFVATGAAGSLITLAAMGIIWSRRMRAVRRPLVEAARHVGGGER